MWRVSWYAYFEKESPYSFVVANFLVGLGVKVKELAPVGRVMAWVLELANTVTEIDIMKSRKRCMLVLVIM